MLSNLARSVLPVMDVDDAGNPRLAATSIVVSSTAVITCRHVIERSRSLSWSKGPLYTTRAVLCGSTLREAARARVSSQWDLCCLTFDEPLDATPATFAYSNPLKGARLMAVGFREGQEPEAHRIPELNLILAELHGGRLQSAQLRGGIPAGYSGGPVAIESGQAQLVVGMVWLGGEEASSSRMIGVDPIAKFLMEDGINLALAELPNSQEDSGLDRRVRMRVGRDVKKSVIHIEGRDIALDIGRDLEESCVQSKGEAPEGTSE